MTPADEPRARRYATSIGSADATTISVLGHDLAGELLGEVGFAELAFWLVAQRRPSRGELRVFEAVLVALAEHGFTPTAVAARLTLAGAPDSLQGAVAAGLLGGGSRFLGATEDTGRFLTQALGERAGAAVDDSELDAIAREAVQRCRHEGRLVPGLGHHLHTRGDPRTAAIIRIAAEEGVRGPHLRLFEAIGRVHPEVLGRTLPLNGAGVCGAALCDLGFAPDILRGFALLARTAGLLGHLAEEMRQPVAFDIQAEVEEGTDYRPPPSPPRRETAT